MYWGGAGYEIPQSMAGLLKKKTTTNKKKEEKTV
jgi:hypothetical protein